MSLRLKLLLISLLTLMLPWAGCQYAREMELVLREGEKQALTAQAQTIATSLQGRNELLYRHQPEPVTDALTPFDLTPIPLAAPPFIDGYADEWPTRTSAPAPYDEGTADTPAPPPMWKFFEGNGDRLEILTGVHERMLFVLLDVHDQHVVFDAPGSAALDPETFGDRIWLGFQDPESAERQVFVSTSAPGQAQVRHIETREYGRQVAVDEPRIAAAWQRTPAGYRVEIRLPLSMIGGRFGVLVDDRDQRGAEPQSYGTLLPEDLSTRGRLIAASPDLGAYLSQFAQPGVRLTVTTPDGRVLAESTTLASAVEVAPDDRILARLYRRFLDEPGDSRVVSATAPIHDRDRRQIIGHLQVTQTANPWLTLRDQALTTLLNFTLITSAIAVLAMFGFAARLAWRLSRLRGASESALTREGLVTTFPETAAPDELGDVARSFSTLLQRLNEYTGYLRTLAGKLAHEIRTPLTIVRSSLENLESEALSPDARVYLERARGGSERLNAILVAMGAATRVEEAIQNAERTRFDLVPVVASAVDAYRVGFPQRQFSAELPEGPVTIEGAPDLIVQMLDKLIDNAVDFSPPGATITVRLRVDADAAVLEVDNPGPPLPRETASRLFESLWQSRSGGDGADNRPHFGLGLYIVRLIAGFHGGEASAMSLPGDSGARFAVRLPRL